jgi:hypothetical protein
METIKIFDEFSEENTDKSFLHAKRTKLEPLIYDILKRKYFRIFEEFWRNNKVTKNSNKSIVIIERRIHPNLAFILRNMFYYARDWCITVVCSEINYNYIKTICTNNSDNVNILALFNGNPSREVAIREYNNLLKDVKFYENLSYDHLFFVQTDTYLRKRIDETMLNYDYVAAPWNWDESSAGGGMSYRKRTAMIDICKNFKENYEMEDGFINEGVKALGYKMPEFMTGITYVAESCHYEDPMGAHQWWTFFNNTLEGREIVFHNYLNLELLKE